jgi:hypothetical protein
MGAAISRAARRRPLATFFVLAYGLTWLAAVPYALGAFPVPLLPCGPALAALVVTPLVGGWPATAALLRRLVQWRAGWRRHRPRWRCVRPLDVVVRRESAGRFPVSLPVYLLLLPAAAHAALGATRDGAGPGVALLAVHHGRELAPRGVPQPVPDGGAERPVVVAGPGRACGVQMCSLPGARSAYAPPSPLLLAITYAVVC